MLPPEQTYLNVAAFLKNFIMAVLQMNVCFSGLTLSNIWERCTGANTACALLFMIHGIHG